MEIGILGLERDLHVQAVSRVLRELGATPVSISPDALRSTPSALLDDEWFVGEQSLGGLRAIWVRQLPPVGLTALDSKLQRDPDRFNEAQLQIRERLQWVMSWLCGLEDAGVAIVNSPRSSFLFIPKPYQRLRMLRAGVPVPQTLYTTSPDAARAFRAQVGPCIVKPLGGGALTQDFDSEDVQSKLDLIVGSPIVVQERIFGENVRVTVVGEEIVSAVVIETGELDYRADPTYHSNAKYREAELSPEAQRISLAAAKASGLSFTGLDLIRGGDRHVVLECNTSPIYLDIERRMGHPISRKIAEHLFQRAKTVAAR